MFLRMTINDSKDRWILGNQGRSQHFFQRCAPFQYKYIEFPNYFIILVKLFSLSTRVKEKLLDLPYVFLEAQRKLNALS